MSWSGQNTMGPNAGNGLGNMGGGDMSGAQGNGNQPHATEYTLQGAFFLFLSLSGPPCSARLPY